MTPEMCIAVEYDDAGDAPAVEALALSMLPDGVQVIDTLRLVPGWAAGDPLRQRGFIAIKFQMT